MKMTGNTILVTGGGSGIGRALAEALQARGNRVIIAGRREALLAEVTRANPGMDYAVLDVEDGASIPGFARQVLAAHPGLNVLINNAGIMQAEDMLAEPCDLTTAEATIAINLLGPIRLTAAFLPHLKTQGSAAVMNVTSGLAFVPLAATPTYSATKAALHSWTQSLRHQLRATSVEVIELAPPMVATDLMPVNRTSPHAMPLDAYIDEVMALLAAGRPEILVNAVLRLRNAEANGSFPAVFGALNPV